MHIRPAALDDYADLCSIDSVVLHGEPARREEIATWLCVGACQMAEMDGRIAANGVLTNQFFGSPFIEMLMVGKPVSSSRVGIALILHFRAVCSGPKLFTSTNMANVPMQALLIKAGFKPSGYVDNLDEKIVFYSPVP